jgi:hypothetical protein
VIWVKWEFVTLHHHLMRSANEIEVIFLQKSDGCIQAECEGSAAL